VYPSIRKLPLLGVTYTDLLRHAKIQEAVFEILTKQYEMAKVQEAKEIPTVKVLDPANYPERRATPRRVLTITMGFLLSLVLAAAWVVGKKMWDDHDPDDPRKVLSIKVWNELKRDTATLRTRSATLLSWRKSRPTAVEPEASTDQPAS
jgi:hypothetical protein